MDYNLIREQFYRRVPVEDVIVGIVVIIIVVVVQELEDVISNPTKVTPQRIHSSDVAGRTSGEELGVSSISIVV